MLYRL